MAITSSDQDAMANALKVFDKRDEISYSVFFMEHELSRGFQIGRVSKNFSVYGKDTIDISYNQIKFKPTLFLEFVVIYMPFKKLRIIEKR